MCWKVSITKQFDKFYFSSKLFKNCSKFISNCEQATSEHVKRCHGLISCVGHSAGFPFFVGLDFYSTSLSCKTNYFSTFKMYFPLIFSLAI